MTFQQYIETTQIWFQFHSLMFQNFQENYFPIESDSTIPTRGIFSQ